MITSANKFVLSKDPRRRNAVDNFIPISCSCSCKEKVIILQPGNDFA